MNSVVQKERIHGVHLCARTRPAGREQGLHVEAAQLMADRTHDRTWQDRICLAKASENTSACFEIGKDYVETVPEKE